MENKETITLISSDDKKIDMSRELITKYSRFIKAALDDKKEKVTELKINVPADHLELCKQYITHHDGKEPAFRPRPVTAEVKLSDVYSDWDAEYVSKCEKDDVDLIKIVGSVEYLQIDIMADKMAYFIAWKFRMEVEDLPRMFAKIEAKE